MPIKQISSKKVLTEAFLLMHTERDVLSSYLFMWNQFLNEPFAYSVNQRSDTKTIVENKNKIIEEKMLE